MQTLEEQFTSELRKITNPFKRSRAEFMGNLMFKYVTEKGIPIDTVQEIVFEQEQINRGKLIEEVKWWLTRY